MNQTIQQAFDRLITRAFPGPTQPGPVQRQEMERMFFAGYSVCFFDVMRYSNLPEPQGEAALDVKHQEIISYFKMLGKVPPDLSSQ